MPLCSDLGVTPRQTEVQSSVLISLIVFHFTLFGDPHQNYLSFHYRLRQLGVEF